MACFHLCACAHSVWGGGGHYIILLPFTPFSEFDSTAKCNNYSKLNIIFAQRTGHLSSEDEFDHLTNYNPLLLMFLSLPLEFQKVDVIGFLPSTTFAEHRSFDLLHKELVAESTLQRQRVI